MKHTKPEIFIEVRGGLIQETTKPEGVKVTVKDYDNTEDHDGNPQEYSMEDW